MRATDNTRANARVRVPPEVGVNPAVMPQDPLASATASSAAWRVCCSAASCCSQWAAAYAFGGSALDVGGLSREVARHSCPIIHVRTWGLPGVALKHTTPRAASPAR